MRLALAELTQLAGNFDLRFRMVRVRGACYYKRQWRGSIFKFRIGGGGGRRPDDAEKRETKREFEFTREPRFRIFCRYKAGRRERELWLGGGGTGIKNCRLRAGTHGATNIAGILRDDKDRRLGNKDGELRIPACKLPADMIYRQFE